MKFPSCLSRRAALGAALIATLVASAADLQPTDALPRATPESQGLASTGLQALIDEADARQFGLHSIMILRHGKVVTEGWWAPYAAPEPHLLFSLSKSFTSTAIGLLQAEGRLNIHDPILRYFPEDAPAQISDNLKAMHLRDMLMMSTGQQKEDVDKIDLNAADQTGTRQFFAAPVKQKPGTLFYYNSPATNVLAATVQKITGQTLRDYLLPRLFAPLGIPAPEWKLLAQGFNDGAGGLYLRTEDVAKFGQLLLQRGEWQGHRLIPADWIDLATSRQASNGSDPDNDWEQGYGFQFWRCVPGFYRADGAHGQFCIVMPQYDTVVAITSGTRDMRGVMKLLWNKLIPELRAAALPANPAGVLSLHNRLASLTIPVPTGAATSPLAAKISGRQFTFDPNETSLESASLEIAADGTVTFKARQFGQDLSTVAGHGFWTQGIFPLTAGSTQAVAVSGAWTADDTYTLKLAEYRTPFIATIRLKFTGDTVSYAREMNVGNGNLQAAPLTGKAR